MGESPAFDDVEADPLFFRPRVFADFVDSPPIHMELLLDNENGVESLHTSETLDRSACDPVGLAG